LRSAVVPIAATVLLALLVSVAGCDNLQTGQPTILLDVEASLTISTAICSWQNTMNAEKTACESKFGWGVGENEKFLANEFTSASECKGVRVVRLGFLAPPKTFDVRLRKNNWTLSFIFKDNERLHWYLNRGAATFEGEDEIHNIAAGACTIVKGAGATVVTLQDLERPPIKSQRPSG
jgi:hypothetical protein